jgi:hypothetical protein
VETSPECSTTANFDGGLGFGGRGASRLRGGRWGLEMGLGFGRRDGVGLYSQRGNGPRPCLQLASGPGRAARRAEATAQARPATCLGPARAHLPYGPCHARAGPNFRASGRALGPRAACSGLVCPCSKPGLDAGVSPGNSCSLNNFCGLT